MTPEEARKRGYGVKMITPAAPMLIDVPDPPTASPPVLVEVTVENTGIGEALSELMPPTIELNVQPIIEAAKESRRIIESADVEHEWERGFPVLTKVKFNYRD